MNVTKDRISIGVSKGERVWYWTVGISRVIAEVIIAYVLVNLAQGAFQTAVVCLLGLIYTRARLFSHAITFMAFLLLRSTTRSVKDALGAEPLLDMDEQIKRSGDEYRNWQSPGYPIIENVENWILTAVFVLPLLKLSLNHFFG